MLVTNLITKLYFKSPLYFKCPAKSQNVRRGTYGSPVKMSAEAQNYFAHSENAHFYRFSVEQVIALPGSLKSCPLYLEEDGKMMMPTTGSIPGWNQLACSSGRRMFMEKRKTWTIFGKWRVENVNSLRVPDNVYYIWTPKTLIFYALPDFFTKPQCIKNLNDAFLTKGP